MRGFFSRNCSRHGSDRRCPRPKHMERHGPRSDCQIAITSNSRCSLLDAAGSTEKLRAARCPNVDIGRPRCLTVRWRGSSRRRETLMSYDLEQLAEYVDDRLRISPFALLKTMAADLNIDRHTIQRALRRHRGCTFAQLQECHQAQAILGALSGRGNNSAKELAASLGYSSTRSLTRRSRSILGATVTDIRKKHRRWP